MNNRKIGSPTFTIVNHRLERPAARASSIARAGVPDWLAGPGLRPEHLRWFRDEVIVEGERLKCRSRDGSSAEIGWESISAPRTGGHRPRFLHQGERGLFRSPARRCIRLVLRDGALPAICRAAAEGIRPETIYAGRPGEPTAPAIAALGTLLERRQILEAVLAFGDHAQGRRSLDVVQAMFTAVAPEVTVTVEAGLPWHVELARSAQMEVAA
jgi:hypothetical protein